MIDRKKTRISWIVALILAALVSLPAWGQPAGRQAGQAQNFAIVPVAIVNDAAVTDWDVEARLRFEALTSGEDYTPAFRQAKYRETLNALIDESLQLQEAEKAGVSVDQRQIQASIERLAQRTKKSVPEFLQGLDRLGVPRETFIQSIEARLAWQAMVVKRLPSSQFIDPDELKAEIEAEKNRAGEVEKNLIEIFLPFGPGAAGQQQTLRDAQALLAAIKSRQLRFDAAAEQFSKASSASDGGRLGWLSLAELDPQLAQGVARVAEGQVSDPIVTQKGVYIVAVAGERTVGQKEGRTLFDLKQLFMQLPQDINSLAAQQKLALAAQIIQNVRGCGPFNDAMISAGDRGSGDLPKVDLSTLPGQIAQVLSQLPVGQPSPPLPVPNGASIFMVCNKQTETEDVDEKEIRTRLINKKAERYSDRLLREVRRQAFIEFKG